MSRPSSPAFERARTAASFFSRAHALLEHVRRLLAGDDADAVVVGDDDIARIDQRAGAHDRHVDAAQGLLDRALRRDVARPDGKAASPSASCTSRTPASMIKSAHAASLKRASPADRRNSRSRRRTSARRPGCRPPTLLDRDVDHPVVARRNADGHRRAGDAWRRDKSGACKAPGGRCGPAPRAPSRRRTAANASATLRSTRSALRTTTDMVLPLAIFVARLSAGRAGRQSEIGARAYK